MADIHLPTWEECYRKQKAGMSLTAIEDFVRENEPAGLESEGRFRLQLFAALSEAWWLGKED